MRENTSHHASESFDYATGSHDYNGFSEEEKGKRITIPNHFQDAIKSPQWKQRSEAINREMASLKEHDVYKLVSIKRVPKDQKTIGSGFLFRHKADGRLKARVVIRRYSQEAGIDYDKIFAPVCCIESPANPASDSL